MPLDESKNNELLQTIHQIQQKYLSDNYTPQSIFDDLLAHLLRITESEYGFIGKVIYPANTPPYLQTYAITNIAWDKTTHEFYKKNAPEGLKFRNLETLFGQVITTKKTVISNAPKTDPLSGGMPKGHPPLNTFLGVPILHNQKLVGMFGIANRADGYDEELVTFLTPFVTTCTLIIQGLTQKEKQRTDKSRIEQIILKQQKLVKQHHEQGVILKKSYEKQQKYAQELIVNKNRLDSILTTIEDVIWSSGLDFSFYINPASENLYGYNETDFQANTNLWFEVIHPKDKPKVSEKLNHFIKNEYIEAEYRIIRKDGEIRYVRTRVWLIKESENVQRMDGITSDMTAIVLAERQFREHLETKVEERTKELHQKSTKLQKVNESVQTSIKYARRLQNAILPDVSEMKKHFADIFVYYMPRDIVSGDFYWFGIRKNKIFISVLDCTGHGVPGAFMSMLGYALLNEIILKELVSEPDKIMDKLSKGVQTTLRQKISQNNDGMDMALCVIDKRQNLLEFAGARNPLLYFEEGEMNLIKGSRKPVGGYQVTRQVFFEKHQIQLKKGQVFYLYSDGYADQFGGINKKTPKGRRFMSKRLRQLLEKNHHFPLDYQADILDQNLIAWTGAGKRIDDITILDFKI